jgi:ketosteroid isomerase-like protein
VSQENIEVVRQVYAAYAAGGIEAVISFYAEDHVAYAVPEWPDDSEYHGPDGLRKLSRQWTENFDNFGLDVRELRDVGDIVVALLEMTGQIPGAAERVRQPVGAVHCSRQNGLIAETRYFLSWREALEAAGLSE